MAHSNQEVLDWVAGAAYFEVPYPELFLERAMTARFRELGRDAQGDELDLVKRGLLRLGTELYPGKLMENLPAMSISKSEAVDDGYGHTQSTISLLWTRLGRGFSSYRLAMDQLANTVTVPEPLPRRRAQIQAYSLRRYEGLFISDSVLSVNVLLRLLLDDHVPIITSIGTSCIDAATKITESKLREVGFLDEGVSLDSLRHTSYTVDWSK